MNVETIKYIVMTVFPAVFIWITKDRIMNVLDIKVSKQNLEKHSLDNVQRKLDLWQEMLDDMVRRYKLTIAELNEVIESQKAIIEEQSKLIAIYEKKHGKIEENE